MKSSPAALYRDDPAQLWRTWRCCGDEKEKEEEEEALVCYSSASPAGRSAPPPSTQRPAVPSASAGTYRSSARSPPLTHTRIQSHMRYEC